MSANAMLAKEVAVKVVNKEKFFLLDVRNKADYDDWKIEGEAITGINIPYFELIDGVEQIVDQLPKEVPILVVCAKEGSSVFVAEMLVEAGFTNVSYLKGGMKAWSEELYPVTVYKDDNMKVVQFIRVGKGCLSYMVVSGEEALVVDPSRFYDIYETVAKQENVVIKHIVDSHLHADHISGGRVLAEKTGADYYLMKSEGAIFDFIHLENIKTIKFEKVQLDVLAVKTPGHTPGSVSFLVNNKVLFSGDTIFIGGLGRPDLGGKVIEWGKDLYDTVYTKLAAITDEIIVLPGHYAELDSEMNASLYIGDTLGNIRNRNEMMTSKTEEEFVEILLENAKNETPPNYEKIISINRGVLEVTEEELQEAEIGPNRCALHHSH